MKYVSSRRGFLATGLALRVLAAPQSKPVGMDRRALGKTGLKVAPLGFGGRGTTEAGVLRRAVDLGVNFFDTGRAYANNERLIGVALKEQAEGRLIAGKTVAQTRQEALADLDTSLRGPPVGLHGHLAIARQGSSQGGHGRIAGSAAGR